MDAFAVKEVEEFVCDENAALCGLRGARAAELYDDAVWAGESVVVECVESGVKGENRDVARCFGGDGLCVIVPNTRGFALDSACVLSGGCVVDDCERCRFGFRLERLRGAESPVAAGEFVCAWCGKRGDLGWSGLF